MFSKKDDKNLNVRSEQAPKTNRKNTKNTPFEKHEFVGFALNEQKKENQKNFKEILKNNPEIYKIIEDSEIYFEENISLGEEIENLELDKKRHLKIISELEKEMSNKNIRELKLKISNLEETNSKLKNAGLELLEINKDLEKEIRNLKSENIKLNNQLNSERKISGFVKDKFVISNIKSENKELKEKLERVGRISISKDKVQEIIRLHELEWGYDRIAKKVKVSKSTVCKYVNRYLKEER